MTKTFLALVTLALAVAPASAAADVIRGPGRECPPGWRQVIRHHAYACDPGTCETGCGSGTTCRESNVCLAMVPRYKQGHLAGESEESVGVCGPGLECKGRCEVQKLCVTDPPVPAPAAVPAEKKSFCAIAGGDLFPFAAALLAPALLRRRRR